MHPYLIMQSMKGMIGGQKKMFSFAVEGLFAFKR